MVRAGRGALYAEDFQTKNIVAISWHEIADNLTKLKDKKTILEIVEKVYPNQKKGWIHMSASQIAKFCIDIQTGDRILTYNSDKRIYLVGTVTSPLKYKKNIIDSFNHYREVKWDGTVSREVLPAAVKNTLGAISTLFFIPQDVHDEIIKLLDGALPEIDMESESQEMENLRLDTIGKSKEFIKDKILNLDWEEMQELVAGIMRAMGYKTRIAPRGPDRGADILASPDGLGLETPRIFVEVKHRQSDKIIAPEIRSFIGGRKPGDSCLYVSTGGFTKDAHYEADRSSIPLTLVNADDLVDLLVSNYENLDNDTKALIPLIKLYWPI